MLWTLYVEVPNPVHGHKLSGHGQEWISAESILTLKNRESIHLGYFLDRLREKNRFMIHEPIHVSLLLYNETWHLMYRDTRFAVFKNRFSARQ